VTVDAAPVIRPVSAATTSITGHSVRGARIVARRLGDSGDGPRVLVIGAIHGNEPAGIAIVKRLEHDAASRRVQLWVIDDLNPDGVRANTRGNAHGVDLNRNFPDRWKPLGPPGSTYYAGSKPLSEPESRALAVLLRRTRPTLGIWYHQALDVIDDSQGPAVLMRRYATDTAMALRRLPDYPGSATGYEDHLFGPTGFVVELPGGQLSSGQVRRHVHAVLDLAQRSAPSRA
jgi:protein MpaA